MKRRGSPRPELEGTGLVLPVPVAEQKAGDLTTNRFPCGDSRWLGLEAAVAHCHG